MGRPYTTNQTNCNPANPSIAEQMYTELKHLGPKVERGFGVELEYGCRYIPGVARGNREFMWAELGKCLKKVRGNGAWSSWSRGYKFAGTQDNKPITPSEARQVGAPLSETKGFGFEIITPGPPNVP